MPRKHWSETNGLKMSEHLHGYVLDALKIVVHATKYTSITANEVTSLDNIAWVGVHVYAMESWES